ncbi:hypothetical protein GGX14DRAFT_674905 [Mycena pura]|uniref:Uncharacterized protein n=1 Tax=Mycena pura TaxID=153505 RepID=A0AAD6VRB0_9AGAR|nr:hypothetical protein GGX14DRAFT_674905 [Mycena pura]
MSEVGREELGLLNRGPKIGAANRRFTDNLLAHPAFIHIAGIAAALFSMWAPQLYLMVQAALNTWKEACDWDGTRRRAGTSRATEFSARPYARPTNLVCGHDAWGLESFDPDCGASNSLGFETPSHHPFCAGVDNLHPKRHSSPNTPVRRGERRSSFVQYTAGALFRWVK